MVKILKETLWIILSAIIAFLIQLPIINLIEYKFIVANTLVIMVTIFYFRLILDFKNIFFKDMKWFKYTIFSLNLFLFVFIITRIQKVLLLFDLFSVSPFSKEAAILSLENETFVISYIQKEYLFFSMFALLVIFILNLKIIGSFWTGKQI